MVCAVLVVTHNSERFLAPCFGSLERALGREGHVSVIVVDNASGDATVSRLRAEFPWVELVESRVNLGFAAGNNLAIARAREKGAEFVFLLNPDTVVEPDFLSRAIDTARADSSIAAVQSLLLLEPGGELVDSAGNAIHFLGFGYCLGHRRPLVELSPRAVVEIAYASGAAVLLRVSAIEAVGGLDERLFLYHEDLDLGWRLRLADYRSVLDPDSRVHHRHELHRNRDKMFFMERNRWVVLLKNLSLRSLLVLSPLLIGNEIAQVAIAARQGWLRQKLRAWRELVRRETWSWIRRERQAVRALRRVPDRVVAQRFVSDMQVEGVTGPFIEKVANPLMGLAWKAARALL